MSWLLCWWWGPWFLVGRLAALVWRWLGWGKVQRIDGVRCIRARGPIADKLWAKGWSGFTFGDTVWLWGEVTAGLVKHEGRHVWQWRRWGLLFPVVYLVLLAIYGYRSHPMEVDARRAAAS